MTISRLLCEQVGTITQHVVEVDHGNDLAPAETFNGHLRDFMRDTDPALLEFRCYRYSNPFRFTTKIWSLEPLTDELLTSWRL